VVRRLAGRFLVVRFFAALRFAGCFLVARFFVVFFAVRRFAGFRAARFLVVRFLVAFLRAGAFFAVRFLVAFLVVRFFFAALRFAGLLAAGLAAAGGENGVGAARGAGDVGSHGRGDGGLGGELGPPPGGGLGGHVDDMRHSLRPTLMHRDAYVRCPKRWQRNPKALNKEAFAQTAPLVALAAGRSMSVSDSQEND